MCFMIHPKRDILSTFIPGFSWRVPFCDRESKQKDLMSGHLLTHLYRIDSSMSALWADSFLIEGVSGRFSLNQVSQKFL